MAAVRVPRDRRSFFLGIALFVGGFALGVLDEGALALLASGSGFALIGLATGRDENYLRSISQVRLFIRRFQWRPGLRRMGDDAWVDHDLTFQRRMIFALLIPAGVAVAACGAVLLVSHG